MIQLLKVGAVGGPAGVPPIVVAGPDHCPAGMGLAFDVSGGGIVLRVQRVEFLVEPMLGRGARFLSQFREISCKSVPRRRREFITTLTHVY
jgi:hypothetical protein